MSNTMKRIKITRGYCVFGVLFYASLSILSLANSVFCAFHISTLVKSAEGASELSRGVCYFGAMLVVFVFLTPILFTELISFLRLRGLEILLLPDGLKISKNAQDYFVDNNDSVICYCMMGWLIVWPLNGNTHLLLLRKGFLNWHGRKLRSYLRARANYLCRSDEKKVLRDSLSLRSLRPWRYIRWPVLIEKTRSATNM